MAKKRKFKTGPSGVTEAQWNDLVRLRVRKNITVQHDVDESRLFSDDMAKSIAYLQEIQKSHPNYTLGVEHDYDGYYVKFEETRLETLEEVRLRIQEWLYSRKWERDERRRKKAILEKELARITRELGEI